MVEVGWRRAMLARLAQPLAQMNKHPSHVYASLGTMPFADEFGPLYDSTGQADDTNGLLYLKSSTAQHGYRRIRSFGLICKQLLV